MQDYKFYFTSGRYDFQAALDDEDEEGGSAGYSAAYARLHNAAHTEPDPFPNVQDTSKYLAEAIGNDMTRAATELRKLYIYGKGKQLELAEVKELVPCQTQNSLQLASAIRQGESNQVLHLLNDLLSRSEPLMVIVATLLTQFRTWLWVKSAIVSGVKKDSELAQLCNISNPNRIYYLRHEVANTSINALAKAVTMMLDLEMSIKRGADSGAVASHRASSKDLLLIILSVSRLFKLT